MGVQTVTSTTEFTARIGGSKPALVDFTAQWCGPCRHVAPHFERLSQQYGDKIVFLKVDVDANQDIARGQNISAMPTFILFLKGKQVEQVVGADVGRLEEICRKYSSMTEAFSGAGRRLSDATTEPADPPPATSTPDDSAATASLDSQKPFTSIQVRLVDGSRHIIKLNTDATIGDLRRLISSKNPGGQQNYKLMSGMPPKYITSDESVTLEQAELEGAVVIQRPA